MKESTHRVDWLNEAIRLESALAESHNQTGISTLNDIITAVRIHIRKGGDLMHELSKPKVEESTKIDLNRMRDKILEHCRAMHILIRPYDSDNGPGPAPVPSPVDNNPSDEGSVALPIPKNADAA